METYTCLTCKKTFPGHEPLDFTDIEIKNKVFPFCPWSKAGLLGSNEFIGLEIDSEKFKLAAEAAKAAIKKHQVVQGDKTPKGSWGTPLKITPASAEKKLSKEETKQLEEAKIRQKVETKATNLLNVIKNCITTEKHLLQPSANYPNDKLYGDEKKLIATPVVIDKATHMWHNENGWCPPSEFKNEDTYRLRNETNFMKLIVPGQPDLGKHNVHVIHVDGDSNIIRNPIFETTIERKIRLGSRINSNWYHSGDMIDGKVPYAPTKTRD